MRPGGVLRGVRATNQERNVFSCFATSWLTSASLRVVLREVNTKCNFMEVRMDGAQLAAKRKAVKLSQQAVAERAKCSLAMVSLLERGYRPEASEVADRIARVLHDAAEAA